MHGITIDLFDDMVVNVIASRCLGFNEAELTAEEHNHNKAFHISVTFANTLVS